MPTTNPVPSQDPSDLLFNAGKLDEVVSGSNATYTDRLGVSRRTMAGIDAAADVVLGGLGYAPPVAYASGISLTLTTKTVEYSGEVYAPKLANLPFTTSTWATDSAKFRLIQGVSATDLAASGGAAMIGYMPAGTGAVATTVQSKLRETVSVKDFGAVGDGITNDTAAIQAAIGHCLALPSVGHTLYFPTGSYRITSTLNFTGGTGNTPITIQGEGWNYNGVQGGTVILGQTGGWMFDCTGIQWFSMQDIVLKGTGANASAGGVLLARASVGVQYDHCIYMKHVTIDIDSKPSFSSLGSIALANNGAEIGLYEHCWFRSDCPHTITYNNELGYTSPFQTIGGPLSTTDIKYVSCQFQATKYNAIYIFGAGNVDFDRCYWGVTDGSGNTTQYAVVLRPGVNQNTSQYHVHGIKLSGQCEIFKGFLAIEDPKVYGCDVDVMMPSPSLPYVYLAQATNLYDCNFRVQHFPDPNQNGTASTGYAVVTPAIGSSIMYGGSVDLFPGTPNDSVSKSTGLTLLGTFVKGHGVNVAGVAATVNANSYFQALGPDGTYFSGVLKGEITSLTAVGATPTVSAGRIGFGTTTTSSATAGYNGSLPAQVSGYLTVNLAGNNVKIPYYNP